MNPLLHDDKLTKNIAYDNDQHGNIDVNILYAGLQKENRNHRVHATWDFNILQYVTKGKGTLKIGDKEWELSEDTLFLLPKGCECQYYSDSDDPYRYYWISFRGSYADILLQKIGMTPQSPTLSVSNNKIKLLFKQIFSEIKKQDEYILPQLLSDFYLIFSILCRETTPAQYEICSISMHNIINEVMNYIQKNFTEEITIQSLSQTFHVNRSYLTTAFKKITGYTPYKYLQNTRISAATKYLTQTDMTILEIAFKVGMDPVNFSQVFKKSMDATPTQYRRLKRKENNMV